MRRIVFIGCAIALLGCLVAAPGASAKKKKHKKVAPVAIIAATKTVPSGELTSVTASCPASKTMVGGGFGVGPAAAADDGTYIMGSHGDGSNGWTASGIALSADPGSVSAYVYCRKGAPPMTEEKVDINTSCSCVPSVTAVATCDPGGKAVAGGFQSQFDLNNGGAFPLSAYRFGAFAWRYDALDQSANGTTVTSYVYCLGKARTQTSGVHVITPDQDTGLGSGTAYAQQCRKKGQKLLAGGFRTQGFDIFSGVIQAPYRNVRDTGRIATGVVQDGFEPSTIESFGYCG